MQMGILPSFFFATTICETHSVGSHVSVIASILSILSSSLLTLSSIARGTLGDGLITGVTLVSSLIFCKLRIVNCQDHLEINLKFVLTKYCCAQGTDGVNLMDLAVQLNDIKESVRPSNGITGLLMM